MKVFHSIFLLPASLILMAVVSIFLVLKRDSPPAENHSDGSNFGISIREEKVSRASSPEIENAYRKGDIAKVIDLARKAETNGQYLWDLSFEEGLSTGASRVLRGEAIRILSLTKSPEELMDLVFENLGSGLDRDSAVGHVFRNLQGGPKVFLKIAGNLDFESERQSASHQYAYLIAAEKSLDQELITSLFSNSELGRKTAIRALAEHPLFLQGEPISALSRRLGESFQIVNTLLEAGTLHEKDYLSIIDSLSSEVPFRLYDLLSKAENVRKIPNSVFREMSRKNPTKVLELAMTANIEGHKDLPIDEAILHLAMSDTSRVTDWLEENRKMLSASQKDEVAHGLGFGAATRGEFDTAREWVGTIKDQELREKVEGQIWSAERSVVRDSAAKNPRELLENIRSGEAGHEEYWIREGFLSWFNQNPDQANEWYSENQASLTPSQTQHVARAYAEVALGEGDINLARQWAEQVVDLDFKQKLVEQINAAAGETE